MLKRSVLSVAPCRGKDSHVESQSGMILGQQIVLIGEALGIGSVERYVKYFFKNSNLPRMAASK